MCIEIFVAVNALADLMLMGAVSRAFGQFNARKLVAVSALTTGYAAVAAARPVPWASLAVQAALLALVSALLTLPYSAPLCRLCALWLAGTTLLGRGIAALMPWRGPLSGLSGCFAAALLVMLMNRARPPHGACWQVRLCLCVEGRCARFPALIDTGNRLREPVSGLPVLIAEGALLRGILPKDGYRVLHYGAVGGAGRLACFKPGAVWVERDRLRYRAPDLWVAVAPGKLPGEFRALAPPVLAFYTV